MFSKYMLKKSEQSEINSLKIQLRELEQFIKEQFEANNYIQNNFPDQLDNNKYFNFRYDNRENFKTVGTLQDKNLISSLLIIPKIKKSSNMSSMNSINFKSSSNENAESAFSDEQILFKEKLTTNFNENLSHLEKSKAQTNNLIENLKSSLNQVESFNNHVLRLSNSIF